MLIDQKFLDEHDREELSGSIAYDNPNSYYNAEDDDKPKKNKGKLQGIVSSLRNSISKKQGANEKKNRAVSGITYDESTDSPNGVNAQDQRSKQPQSIADVSAINQKTDMNATRNLDGEISMTDETIADFLGNENNYLMVDMGQIEEEDMPFMIIDKDSGKMYDMRNDRHVERLTDVAATFGTSTPALAGFGGA